jgi:hypothetical protein
MPGKRTDGRSNFPSRREYAEMYGVSEKVIIGIGLSQLDRMDDLARRVLVNESKRQSEQRRKHNGETE